MNKHGTKISWTHLPGYKGETWNVILGCSRVSPGCSRCYAEVITARFAEDPKSPFHGLATITNSGEARWTNEIRFMHHRIHLPKSWREPRCVFVNSMGDLFHKDVPFDFLSSVFDVMTECNKHIFIILTKRPEIMRDYMQLNPQYVQSHIWLGTSVENQETVNERLPILISTLASKKVVSAEPLLGPIDISDYHGIDWILIGGESGVHARPFHVEWGLNLIAQCREIGVVPFMKQLGRNPYQNGKQLHLKDSKGGDPNEWVQALQVQEWPY